METPENDDIMMLNMEVKVNPDNKKQVLLTLSGLERRTVYEFSTEEDAKAASRLGGQIFSWFMDAKKLNCSLEKLVTEEPPTSDQPFQD
jgi:hypothetical protein